MTIKIDYSQFNSAIENMRYDTELLNTQHQNALNTISLRLYEWPNFPSITLPKNRPLLPQILPYDYAYRPTGGGIVFHNPSDLLFTLIAPLAHPLFPKRFKDKLHWLSEKLKSKLTLFTENISESPISIKSDITFCNSYPNPYEIYSKNHKIVGLAQRRFKDQFMVQGIVHTQSNFTYFDDSFKPNLTMGLNGEIETQLLLNKLTSLFNK
tara:strand:+ start:311 stop:940 length:630 start_codon:yes stop_codon:yes gene_type:complete